MIFPNVLELEQCLLQIAFANKICENKELLLKKSANELIEMLCELNPSNIKQEFLIFGSFLNGFGTSESDIDITITTNCFVDESVVIAELATLLRAQSRYEIIGSFPQARIPVIKMKDIKLKVCLDLCCNNILGAINTQLLRAYSLLDQKVWQGGILLKLWAKGAKIISNFHFSSYSIILLWIHFLQQKFALPNLQNYNCKQIGMDTQIKIKRNVLGTTSQFTVDTFFIYYGEQYEKIQSSFQQLMKNIPLVYQLQGFFQYYSTEGEGFNQDCRISINCEKIEKKPGLKYSMIDPFDLQHDPILKVNNSFNRGKAFNNALLFFSKIEDIKLLFNA